jgi:hypothetical protein
MTSQKMVLALAFLSILLLPSPYSMSKPEYDGCSNDCGYSQIPAQSTQLFENNQSTKTLFWQVDLAPLAGPPEALVDWLARE